MRHNSKSIYEVVILNVQCQDSRTFNICFPSTVKRKFCALLLYMSLYVNTYTWGETIKTFVSFLCFSGPSVNGLYLDMYFETSSLLIPKHLSTTNISLEGGGMCRQICFLQDESWNLNPERFIGRFWRLPLQNPGSKISWTIFLILGQMCRM